MRRFLGLVVMGALALGVAHAEEDYASMSNKDFVKLAGTLHSAEEVLDYQVEFDKRLKEIKGSKAKLNFKAQVNKAYRTNLAKMSAKDFAALRKEVAEALEEKKKDHQHKELVDMGLDVEVCKTKKRELLCPHRHAKKHASKHGGEGKHGHHGVKHEHKEGAKSEEHKAKATKSEEHKEEHKEVKQEKEGEHHE
ncbi:DUF1104 domain-containing protein [Helicobacter baculiformis]|uniref:DUF1104 domain-containing protein n=1 Tax=Helicobacter baculiformis TaxID=427351 RepID=A0ABV7ZH09_9HELI|nr:DUF1104 domain-containing protein [Helicobacter baculiformis]